MATPPVPASDHARLIKLRDYEMRASLRQQACDRVTQIAAVLFQAPLVAINLIGKDRQWLRTSNGTLTQETGRSLAICADVAASGEMTVVLDAAHDARFTTYPYIDRMHPVRFYAGVPLRTADGAVLGTLCILDSIARSEFPAAMRAALQALAAGVVDWMEQQKTIRQLSRLAFHDVLTGLPNRRLFRDRLKQAIAAADRDQTKVVLAMIDLDDFKFVNDTRGHDAGDALLKQIATLLSGAVRTRDSVARWGGDEFVCCFSVDHQGELDPLLARLTDAIAETDIEASIGIAFYPDDAHSIPELLKAADKAMYHIKRSDEMQASA